MRQALHTMIGLLMVSLTLGIGSVFSAPPQHFKWAFSDADSAAVLAACRLAVPGFGFSHTGLRGTVGSDTVTVKQHDRFSPRDYAKLTALFDSLAILYGPTLPGFTPLVEEED